MPRGSLETHSRTQIGMVGSWPLHLLTKKEQQVSPEEAKIAYVGNLSSSWILEGSCFSKAIQN